MSQYKSGMANMIRSVDNARPPMTQTAISIKKASEMSGVMPKMVVPLPKSPAAID